MSGRNKAFTEQVKQEALSLVASSGVNLLEDNVVILPLAKRLMESSGCGIDTAKVKIAWAARRLRYIAIYGEQTEGNRQQWGGKRENATGRPRLAK